MKRNYYYKTVAVIPSGQSLSLLLAAPAAPNIILLRGVIYANEEYECELFENVTTTANGTEVAVNSANRNDVVATGLRVYSSPTIATGGGGTRIWDGRTAASMMMGGVATEVNYDIALKYSLKYLLKITKLGQSSSFVDVDLFWTESRPEAI